MKTIELQKNGQEFLKDVLAGGDYLAVGLRETLPLDEGACWTFIPDNVNLSDLSLQQGGLSKHEYTDDLTRPVVDLINTFLNSSADHICVIECTSQPAEELEIWLKSVIKGFKYITTAETTRSRINVKTGEKIPLIGVYGFATRSDAVSEYIYDFIDEAFPFRQIGALTSLGGSEPPVSGSLVEKEWLNALASRTEYIFVGAFDGDGWVVWARPGSRSPNESCAISSFAT